VCKVSSKSEFSSSRGSLVSQSGIKSLTKDVPKHDPLKFYTVKVRGLANKHVKKHIKQFFCPIKRKSIRILPKIKDSLHRVQDRASYERSSYEKQEFPR